MIKIAILGATGQTGLHLVEQALKEGHEVVVVVRNAAKISHIQHEKLHAVEGDIFSSESLQQHFEGCDAILSCLGTNSLFTTTTLYSESVKSIVAAMRGADVKRLIVLTSWYVTIKPDDDPGYMARWVIRPMLHKPLNDMAVMERYLLDECQDIDYTSVKPPQLTNHASQGKEFAIEEREFTTASKLIPRADVARFMLQCLKTDEYNKRFMAIGLK